MWAICCKEIKSLFKSMYGWIFLAAFTLFSGIYFVANNIYSGSPYISYSVYGVFVVLIFIVPLLTMKSFSEEKRQKTDQLLLTSPVKLISIVLGKYLALVIMSLLCALIMCAYLGLMCCYGKVPLGQSFLAILALFLFTALISSIGMFISSLTEHQFLAALFSYLVFIFFLLAPGLVTGFFGSDNIFIKIFSFFDYYSTFDVMLGGILDLKELIKILSFIFVFNLLTYYSFGKNVLSLNTVGKKKFILDKVTTFVIVILVVGLNILCTYLPVEYSEFDYTGKKLYSITKETKDYLNTLDKDVTVYILADKQESDLTVRRIVNQYDKYSSHINVEYKSPDTYPQFYAKYTEEAPSMNSLIVVCGENFRVIDYDSLYEYKVSYDQYYQENRTVTGVDVEGQLTAGIQMLVNNDIKSICFTEGHGEVTITADLRKRFSKACLTVDSFSLLEKDIPENCETLVINSPAYDFSPEEINKLNDYVDNGGKLICFASLDIAETDNYDAFIESFGVELSEGTVIDDNLAYGTYNYVLITTPLSTDITQAIVSDKRRNIFPQTRGITSKELDGFEITTLASSSENAYAKQLYENTELKYDASTDVKGPFDLAVYCEKKVSNGTAKCVIIGSPYFIESSIDQIASKSNSDLFFAAVTEMTDNELHTTVAVKSYGYENLVFKYRTMVIYLGVVCLLLPLSFIVAGIALVIIRKKK